MGTHLRWTCDDCGHTVSQVKSHAVADEHWYWHRVDAVTGKTVYMSLVGCFARDSEGKVLKVANAVMGDTPRPTGERVPYVRRERPAVPPEQRRIIPREPQFTITPYVESPDFDAAGHPLGITEDDRHRAFLRKRMRELRGELHRAGLCVECAGDHSHYHWCSQFRVIPDTTVEVEREFQDAV